MTHGTGSPLRFSGCRSRRVEADFTGGVITGNGGVMLVSKQDRRLGPSARRPLPSDGLPAQHPAVAASAAACPVPGPEDLNDHDELRHDVALQTMVDRDTAPASASTLCRFESQADRSRTVSIHREQQPDLFAERTGCSPWWPNRYRMLPGGLAHVLPEQVRRNGL